MPSTRLSDSSLLAVARHLTRITPRDPEAWIMLGHAYEASVWGAEALEQFPLWPWIMRDPLVEQHLRYNRGEDVPMVAPSEMTLSFVRHEDLLIEPTMAIEENRFVIKTAPKHQFDRDVPDYFRHRAWTRDLENGYLALKVRADRERGNLAPEELADLERSEGAYLRALAAGANATQLDVIGMAALRFVAVGHFALNKAVLPSEITKWWDVPPPAHPTPGWNGKLEDAFLQHPATPQSWRVRLLFALATEPYFPGMGGRWNDGNVVDELDDLFDEEDAPPFLYEMIGERCRDLAREALVLLVEEIAQSSEDYHFPIPDAPDVPVLRLTKRVRDELAARPSAVNFATTMIFRYAGTIPDEDALPWQMVSSRMHDARMNAPPRAYSKERSDHEWKHEGETQIPPRVQSPVYIRWDKPDEWPAKADELNALLDALAPFE